MTHRLMNGRFLFFFGLLSVSNLSLGEEGVSIPFDDGCFRDRCHFVVSQPNGSKMNAERRTVFNDPPTCDPGLAEKKAEKKRADCLKEARNFCDAFDGIFWSKETLHGNAYFPGWSEGKIVPLLRKVLVPTSCHGTSGAKWECCFF